ncbi:uncharacterized protein PGTG_14972 [Puccinia graminis f. sp. tritici CRL 75-36-700-3]|uniref:SET domain-containing protein n=1 Tax=Puccinia graminis f. sp. tritici (strain CRL 75-36-700-3 / race SCCL) TaxID=418459 RepID=E3KXR9_PUCGT|nr:uncharacterized protein PGTG_14972 [Puccinia graminis f. sp. tritici CRL 75-36-700-3]EFP89131.1 hypothetical protein PGTG_14972 [Puccinia graminis f. sp. tritici CRL 75-36-700-3]
MWKYLLALASIYPHILLASYDSNLRLLGLSVAQTGQRSDEWANSTDLICKPSESPFFSSSQNLVYKYDKIIPPTTLIPFRDGFSKSTCFANPIDNKPEEYCIFINPTINGGQGMVVVTPTELFEDSLNDGLKLSDDPPNPESLKVVPMPEKGGMGALAARNLRRGDPVQRTRPVALVAAAQPIWSTRLGRSIRRQAIDHLPLHTRAAIASLHGQGQTEDEFISSVIEANMFATKLFGDEATHFGALVLQGSRLNHACRPNVVYYVDHETQLLHMTAFESISMGEELTISYRSLEMDRASRQDDLQESYGFRCTCSHCQMSAELGRLSDQRLLRIAALKKKYFSEDPKFSADDVNELVNLCQTEKIPWCITLSNLIAAEFFNSLGKIQEVKEHAEEAKSMGLLIAGAHWPDLGEVELLLSEPEKHNSHFSRQ